MNIEIRRYRHKGEAIDGELYADGQKLCQTAENATTALPSGRYRIVRTFCKQYNRFVPKILLPHETEESLKHLCLTCDKVKGVTNNTTLPLVCHQLKMGNGIHKREDGSIIMGSFICPRCLKYTREPYENLSERIRKMDGRGTVITLTILNS